jgi:hypothetical protein
MTAKDTQTEAPGVESMPENSTEKGTGDGAHESSLPREIGGRDGPDPTRYGDWEKNGRCIDF